MRAAALAAVFAITAAIAAAPRADVLALLDEHGATLKPLGGAGGLAGWHVTPADGDPYTLYVAPDGHAVVGLLYDPTGALVTSTQLAAAVNSTPPQAPAPSVQPVTASAADQAAFAHPAASAGGFVLGHTGAHVQVFADPACRWSRITVAELAAEAIAGRLVLEVLPVALLGEESARMALATAAGGAEAWFNQSLAEPDAATAAVVRANNARFQEAGGTAVPLLVWQGEEGTTRTQTGMPASVGAFLQELGR